MMREWGGKSSGMSAVAALVSGLLLVMVVMCSRPSHTERILLERNHAMPTISRRLRFQV